MRNSTLPRFRLAWLVSSYHDTFSTRPPHREIHAAPKTMSHTCDCNIIANVWLVCHVITFLECAGWLLHCLRAAGASGNLPYRGMTSMFLVIFQEECVGLSSPVCIIYPIHEGEETSNGFLFWVMVPSFVSLGLLVVFACKSGLNNRSGVSGVQRPPPKITPTKTKRQRRARTKKTNTKNKYREARAHSFTYNKYREARVQTCTYNKYREARARMCKYNKTFTKKKAQKYNQRVDV